MNIWEMVSKLLADSGCRYTISQGIVYVVTPDGELWDFTLPLPVVFNKVVSIKKRLDL
jgi:hypothetical protein